MWRPIDFKQKKDPRKLKGSFICFLFSVGVCSHYSTSLPLLCGLPFFSHLLPLCVQFHKLAAIRKQYEASSNWLTSLTCTYTHKYTHMHSLNSLGVVPSVFWPQLKKAVCIYRLCCKYTRIIFVHYGLVYFWMPVSVQ